ncbi:MAG TPA: AmmeMemoRadiSam system protein A [Thermoanaerobaculia bacterium]|jgi:AmmeMemoRadiSam system protein A|nr:AmmeMemoRadiSam system protein A [Thermoanaerobaculia bacterium]
MLNSPQRRQLLALARESIATVFAGKRPELKGDAFDEELRRPSGAFVTLTQGEELRGCIGSIEPVAPLYVAVSQSAISAAFRDPRFHPLSSEELPGIHIEISVMGPIERVVEVEEIVVGRDGLIIRRGGNAGLLLPQVATDYGWDREMFLQQTCYKAGLPRNSWREAGTTIEKFAAEVFGEKELIPIAG